ncbi:MAG TPA: aspartyl protease family protein [Puia sp.]|uniref:aspartyl protease family protein n=1 Tax=Puia sp. TaxID=2045100 RepID=UPI002B6FA1C5|nr:aspartyl protease family protein [Puia sp.]HVU97158.1 aspartyl protease family protein [Puia sp.]
MIRSLFLLLTLLVYLPGEKLHAQETFVQPASRLIATFPFTVFTGGVILLKARINDFPDSLNFILDTGSGGISLDSETCVRLRMTPLPSDKTILGIAGVRQVKFLYNQVLHLPGLDVDSLNFHVNDYDILTSVYGEKVDGIIGYSFFSRYIVQINYDSSRVSVWTRGNFRYPRGGYMIRPVIASLPIIGAQVRDARNIFARFYFDTGAGLCTLLSSDFVNDSSILDSRKKIYYTSAQGLGGKATMRLTTVRDIRVGPYHFHKVPTYIFDDQYNVTSYPNLGGLVGNDIFRRFNVTLNYDRRVIYLVPNSHYRDLFDYSYTGLGLYWMNGEVRIGDVMKDSPAEKAGFKEDDIVLSVGNNFSNNIQAYKSLLQNTGEKLKLIVNRKGELLQLTLQVKSIK